MARHVQGGPFMMNTTTATWTKLKSGDWGVRVPYACGAGDSVTVTKKSGETSTVVIDRVVWSGQGVALCAVAPRGGSSRSSGGSYRRRSRYVPCGYPGCSPGYCDECDGEGRYGSQW